MVKVRLDRRISFERFSLVDDGFSEVESWAVHGTRVAASKTDISDGERMSGGAESARLTSRFVVRSSAFTRGLTPKDRLNYNGEIYAIHAIKELGRNNRLEITAGALVDD